MNVNASVDQNKNRLREPPQGGNIIVDITSFGGQSFTCLINCQCWTRNVIFAWQISLAYAVQFRIRAQVTHRLKAVMMRRGGKVIHIGVKTIGKLGLSCTAMYSSHSTKNSYKTYKKIIQNRNNSKSRLFFKWNQTTLASLDRPIAQAWHCKKK